MYTYACVFDKSVLSVGLAWFTPLCYAFFISPDPSICVWFDNLLSLFVTRTMLVQELTNELTFFCTPSFWLLCPSYYWKFPIQQNLSYNCLSLFSPPFQLFICKTNQYSL